LIRTQINFDSRILIFKQFSLKYRPGQLAQEFVKITAMVSFHGILLTKQTVQHCFMNENCVVQKNVSEEL